MRVGASVWPGYEPMFLARHLGYYNKEQIRLLDFPSATEVIRAYRNRAIDAASVTLDEALLLAETMPGQRIVLVCDFSNGADAIVARPPLRSMAELKGRRIAVESGALGAFVLSRALAIAGMATADVTMVSVPVNEHRRAYRTGSVDAVVTFDPTRAQLLADGARQVFASSEIPGEIVDVIVTHADVLESNRPALEAFVAGWFHALDFLHRQGVSPDAAGESFKLLELPDRAANLRLLSPSTEGLTGSIQKMSALMRERGLLLRPGRPELGVDDRVVRAARP